MDLELLNEDPSFAEAFNSVGCMRFCQKLQGFHAQVSKYFAVSFVGIASKVGVLSFVVSPKTISLSTEILRMGEEWLKSSMFKLQNYDEFVKPEHIGVDMTSGIPRSYLQ